MNKKVQEKKEKLLDVREKARKKSRSTTKEIKRERSRENSLIKNIEKKIKIKIIDDSNSKEPTTIKNYLQQNKNDYKKEKITLQEYIIKNDVDQEYIYLFLENLLKSDTKEFYRLYSKEQFKLALTDRLKLQSKFQNNSDIPKIISNNIITHDNIKKIYINILSNINEVINDIIDIQQIKDIFINNKVYFEEEIDFKVPNKHGSIELKYYSLLSDIFYYFDNNLICLESKIEVFFCLEPFIKEMEKLENDELICCSNLLINILYMFLDNKNIDLSLFNKIAKSCLPFDIDIANNTLKKFVGRAKIKINGVLLNKTNCLLKDGTEIITFEQEKMKKKIETQAKNINWYLGNSLFLEFLSDSFMLCVRYPFNTNFNYFLMDQDIKNSVENFFQLIISSPSMKQAMIIDRESSQFKYLFDNKEILKEFENNTHYVVLPFENYFGFTDKKSMDIYINILIKYNTNFILTLTRFELFFISKAHEFKHASSIYLRLFNNKINIKTPTKSLKKFKAERSYIKKIFYNSKEKLIKATINCSKNSQEFKEEFSEYGDLLEISLFGQKLNKIFLKTIIFCLTESSWKLSPTDFYYEYSCNMNKTKSENIKELCNGNFLNKLYQYFDFQDKDKYYENLLISKSTNYNNSLDYQFISIERKSHEGFKKNIAKIGRAQEHESKDKGDGKDIEEFSDKEESEKEDKEDNLDNDNNY